MGGSADDRRRELLEREDELGRLRDAVREARRGSGSIVRIDGPAGIGKTALLSAARELAHASRMTILSGRGRELEREFAFGVARQLFEPELVAATPERRAALLDGAARLAEPVVTAPVTAGGRAGPDRGFGPIHGLYWLTANLADAQPVAVLVDDAHWADLPTLRFIAYLGARCAELPVVLVIGVRSGERSDGRELLRVLDADPAMTQMQPASLSSAAVTEIVGARLGTAPDAAFCDACTRASGGNPFLLGELLTELSSEQVLPVRDAVGHVEAARPASVARGVLARMLRLGHDAEWLARAVAVLETGELRDAATLAELDPDVARRATDRLVAAEIITPPPRLAFVHPLLRHVVYERIPPAARADGHRRAALLLADQGMRGLALGAHLLRAEATGDERVVGLCREAAGELLAGGDPAGAGRLLARALAEPVADPERGTVLGELGEAEALARDPGAAEHLRAALRSQLAPEVRVRLVSALAQWLVWNGQAAEGFAIVGETLESLGDDLAPPLRAALETVGMAIASVSREHIAIAERRLEELHELALAAGPAGAALFITEGCVRAQRGPWAGPWRELIDRGLGDGRFVAAHSGFSPVVDYAAAVFIHGDEVTRATRLLGQMRADSVRRGSIHGHLNAVAWSALLALRRGELAQAEDDARTALELATRHEVLWTMLWVGATLTQALCERGGLDAADAVSAAAPLDGAPPSAPWLHGMLARARLRLAQDRRAEAAADLRAVGAHTIIDNPSYVPWRSALAAALGPGPEAAALAAEELERARELGQPRGIAGALCSVAAAGADETPIATLTEAVGLLRDSPARLELARTLCDLGAGHRRRGERSAARELLRESAELAWHCGATPLADRAQEELRTAGARPRRGRFSGPEALTASELRVAELAAAGRTNREIAQALFVTTNTVGTHLGHVYAKLGLGGAEARERLGPALGSLTGGGSAGFGRATAVAD
jgi:DNA-binding CsgD family transcriptional regulator